MSKDNLEPGYCSGPCYTVTPLRLQSGAAGVNGDAAFPRGLLFHPLRRGLKGTSDERASVHALTTPGRVELPRAKGHQGGDKGTPRSHREHTRTLFFSFLLTIVNIKFFLAVKSLVLYFILIAKRWSRIL